MKRFAKTVATIAGVCAFATAFAGPALAHHSFAMFDQTKIIEKNRATVAEFRFTNPHSFIVVNVQDGGNVTRYVLECSSVNMMSQGGWKYNTLKAGDKVDLAFYPLRNGKPGGMLKTIKVADGRVLKAW